MLPFFSARPCRETARDDEVKHRIGRFAEPCDEPGMRGRNSASRTKWCSACTTKRCRAGPTDVTAQDIERIEPVGGKFLRPPGLPALVYVPRPALERDRGGEQHHVGERGQLTHQTVRAGRLQMLGNFEADGEIEAAIIAIAAAKVGNVELAVEIAATNRSSPIKSCLRST